MTQLTLDRLASAAMSNSARSLEISSRNDYSGRGMYGKTTYALTVNSSDIYDLVAIAASKLEGEELLQFIGDMRNLRQDSMGLDYIYY